MDDSDRIALHRKLSAGMIDAFAHCVERQRVELPPEFVVSEDATLWAPIIYGETEHQYARELGATGRTPSERNTLEFQNYWKVMPDFRLVDHSQPFVTEVGFSVWFRFGGTTRDGRSFGFYEVDFIQTNERGEIARMETFHDELGLAAVLELFGVRADSGWEALRELRQQSEPGDPDADRGAPGRDA